MLGRANLESILNNSLQFCQSADVSRCSCCGLRSWAPQCCASHGYAGHDHSCVLEVCWRAMMLTVSLLKFHVFVALPKYSIIPEARSLFERSRLWWWMWSQSWYLGAYFSSRNCIKMTFCSVSTSLKRKIESQRSWVLSLFGCCWHIHCFDRIQLAWSLHIIWLLTAYSAYSIWFLFFAG